MKVKTVRCRQIHHCMACGKLIMQKEFAILTEDRQPKYERSFDAQLGHFYNDKQVGIWFYRRYEHLKCMNNED